MSRSSPANHAPHRLLALTAALGRAETVEAAVSRVTDIAETVFDEPAVGVCERDADGDVTTLAAAGLPRSTRDGGFPGRLPESVVARLDGHGEAPTDSPPQATVDGDPPEPFGAAATVPVGHGRALRLGVTGQDGFDEADVAAIEGVAANLEPVLARAEPRSAAVDCDVARALFDGSDTATVVSDTDGALVAANRAACELTGRGREALLTSDLSALYGDAAASVRRHLDDAAAVPPEQLTTSVRRPDEATVTVELTSRRVDVGGTTYIRTAMRESSAPSTGRPNGRHSETRSEDDAAALRRLNELAVRPTEFDATIEELLRLGCDYFGLDTAVLSHVDGDDYEVEAVVGATGTHEVGAVYDLEGTVCQATVAGDATEPVVVADAADADDQDHTAAGNAGAYIAAPVVVGDGTYGAVNFSKESPREAAFRPAEREFLKLVAQWIGTELDRRRRFEELERYETILDALGDPVYALDADGRFTFVNDAAEREFGYGEEVLGERPSVGMDGSDVERIRERIEALLTTDDRSTTAEFELETADGGHKTVESRLTLLGDGEFRGTAGVLRDITAREERRRQLESFQQAIDKAADGIAVLDGEEYTYVDQSHVEMYGLEDKEQLLGNTWRKLYDDDEIERLEQEAFPALDAEGYWRGTVTGSRPDGSTFPAELSLTIIEDGRLVCAVRDETERRKRERELELKKRAMDEADVGIQITGPSGEDNPLVYVNDGFERMTGYDGDEILGRTPRFLHGEDTDPEQAARLGAALRAEEPASLELKSYRKNGTPYWAQLSTTPVSDESGAVRNYIVIQQDVTERRARERQKEATIDAFERMYQVTTDSSLSFEEKVDGLLATGSEYLGLPYGFLTRIDTDDGQGTQRIVEARGSHDLLQPGESCPLPRSYCRRTIQDSDLSIITDAAEAGWAGDPAYETFGLETYIAGSVSADATTYGTLCFASSEPRAAEFTQTEQSFVNLVRRWVSYELDRRATREDLRQQRERLELTLSGTDTGLIEWELETDTVAWNRTLVDLVGRDVGSIDEFEAAVHPDDRDRVRERLTAMRDDGEPWVGEFRMRGDAGGVTWIKTRAVVTDGDDGEPRRVLATGTDITDRKREERERRRNERRFESLFEDPQTLVGLLDTDGTVLTVNGTSLSYVDATAEAVRGERFWETPWWDHSADLQADLERWIRRAAEGEYVDYEATHPGPDGETRHVRGTVRPVTGESGSIESLVVSGRDVTEQKQGERELRDRQRKLDLVLSNTDTSVAELDLESGAIRWDEMPGDDGIGSPESLEGFMQAVHPEDRASVQSAVETMGEGEGESLDSEFRLLNEAGDTVWVATQAVQVTDESGDPTGDAVAIATDVTALKQRERAVEASRERYRSLAESIPNGGVLTFDADLEYGLAAGELIPELGLDPSDISGTSAGTVLPDAEAGDELVPHLRAALDGERTDRRVEIRDRTIRLQIVPLHPDDGTGEARGLVLAQDVTEEARREQELFEERERFRLLTESVDEYAFVVVDENGVVQTWGESGEEMFGYDTETAVGLSVAELHPEADRVSGLPDRLLQQARVAGESAHEGWRVRADGSQFYADVRYAPLRTDDEESRGYAMIVRDMTDRRRQRRRTERFVEESDDVVTILDTDGTVTYSSGSAERVLGHDPEDLVGENLFDHVHPDGRERAMEAFFASVEAADGSFEAEYRVRSGDGEWLNVQGQCRNMLQDGAIDGMLLYLRDVTERKKRQRRFESIFNQTFQFTGLLEPDGTVIEVNEAALSFGGFDRDTIVGKPFSDASWWTHSETVRADVRDALARAADGEFVRYETEVRGVDGLATIDFSAKPVTDDDGDVSLLVVEGRDITARQQHRRHLEVMQRVMRHNMRNDLTKVRGWTQVMCEEADADRRAEQFETVERILDKWDAMTEKMGEIRQVLRSPNEQAMTQECGSLIDDAVAPVREAFDGVTVSTDTSKLGPIQLPATLLDAVRELVTNAASESDSTAIEVELARQEGEWVELLVRDDGPGMPEMEADVLESGEETPLNHGQGLGLWMVRMIVTQIGGGVSVASTDDGTVVSLRIPTGRTEAVETARPVGHGE